MKSEKSPWISGYGFQIYFQQYILKFLIFKNSIQVLQITIYDLSKFASKKWKIFNNSQKKKIKEYTFALYQLVDNSYVYITIKFINQTILLDYIFC